MGKQFPRIDGVGKQLQKDVEFKSGNIRARLLLNELVFQWKRIKGNRLFERNRGYSRNKKCTPNG
jgi:hypothetical protein